MNLWHDGKPFATILLQNVRRCSRFQYFTQQSIHSVTLSLNKFTFKESNSHLMFRKAYTKPTVWNFAVILCIRRTLKTGFVFMVSYFQKIWRKSYGNATPIVSYCLQMFSSLTMSIGLSLCVAQKNFIHKSALYLNTSAWEVLAGLFKLQT